MKSENILYYGDCFFEIDKITDGELDLIITSPPYNVDLGNNKFNGDKYNSHNDNMNHTIYISWLKDIFQKCYTKTKSGGRCVINVGDGKNGKIPTHSDIIQFMIKIGWLPMATIIWEKNTTSNRTAWGSWLSPSSPSFPRTFEYILFFCKESYKLQYKGFTDLKRQEFIDWSLATWTFPGERKKNSGHPAAFPIELPTRCIKMLTWIGATVLDPFMGSGTTGVACKELNRNFIGIENDEKYFNIAKERTERYVNKLFEN